ncbi:MAG: hypothetical protein K2K05_09830, partial [Muribaculaceae bacterium]|nr:hypothetical protein [Muribaculaceae bacterium]
DNINELNHYRKVMSASEDFHLPQSVPPIPISTANFNTLLEQGRTFDDYFRFLQKHNYESPQLQLTDASEVETLEEAEAAEAAMIEAEAAEAAEPEAIPDAVQPDDPASVDPTVTVPDTENTTVAAPTPESKPEQTPAPASISKKPTPPAATPLPDGSEGEDDPLLQ